MRSTSRERVDRNENVAESLDAVFFIEWGETTAPPSATAPAADLLCLQPIFERYLALLEYYCVYAIERFDLVPQELLRRLHLWKLRRAVEM